MDSYLNYKDDLGKTWTIEIPLSEINYSKTYNLQNYF